MLCSFARVKIASIAPLDKQDAVFQAFVRNNTTFPVHASVERVFSVAVDISPKKPGKTSDEAFESQLSLKILSQ